MDRFLNDILPSVPSCPGPTIRRAVLSKAIEFCQQSSIWHEEQIFTADGGESSIELLPPEQSRAFRVEVTRNGVSCLTFDLNDQTLDFDTVFTKDEEIHIRLFLVPVRTATSIPDQLYHEYFDALTQGALAHLMLMPNKEWTNPQLAVGYQGDFMYYITQAKIAAIRRHPQTKLRMNLTLR
jgi:hypothetical protein